MKSFIEGLIVHYKRGFLMIVKDIFESALPNPYTVNKVYGTVNSSGNPVFFYKNGRGYFHLLRVERNSYKRGTCVIVDYLLTTDSETEEEVFQRSGALYNNLSVPIKLSGLLIEVLDYLCFQNKPYYECEEVVRQKIESVL